MTASHDQHCGRQPGLPGGDGPGDDGAGAAADQSHPVGLNLGPLFGPVDQPAHVDDDDPLPFDSFAPQLEKLGLVSSGDETGPICEVGVTLEVEHMNCTVAVSLDARAEFSRWIGERAPDGKDDDEWVRPRQGAPVVLRRDEVVALAVVADGRDLQ